MATVLEYMVTEVIELAGNYAKDNKPSVRNRIVPRHISFAIENDDELNEMFKKTRVGRCPCCKRWSYDSSYSTGFGYVTNAASDAPTPCHKETNTRNLDNDSKAGPSNQEF